jgi:hypothetical protein
MAGWRLAPIDVVLAGAVGAFSTTASAAVPAWSAPERIAEDGLIGHVAIGAGGDLTVAWHRGSRQPEGVLAAVRRKGERRLGAPVELAGPGARLHSLVGNERGEALATVSHEGRLRAFIRISGGHFGPAQEIATNQSSSPFGPVPPSHMFEAASAINRRGAAIIAYTDADRRGIQVTFRAPGGGFGPSEQLEPEDFRMPNGSKVNLNSGLAVAINDRGDAVIAWTASSDPYTALAAAYRPAGGSFGPPTFVSENGVRPAVAIDGQGDATIVFEGVNRTGPYPMMASEWPAGASPTAPREIGNNATRPTLVQGPGGDLLAFWQSVGPSGPISVLAAFGRNGARLGPARPVLTADADRPHMALDAAGNAPAVWVPVVASRPTPERPPDRALRAAVITRFGLTEDPVAVGTVRVNSIRTEPTSIDANDAGATAVSYTEYYTQHGDARLYLLERPSDESPPRLAVSLRTAGRPAALASRRRASVRCDEICRVRADVFLRRVVARRGWQRLSAGQRATFQLRLSLRERRRARRLLRGRVGRSARVVFKAEDAAGNRRIVRRRIALRRLLR